MTDPSQLQALFARAVALEGLEYVAARNTLLEQGPAALPVYGAQVGADWRSGLTAAVLAGWLHQRTSYEQCTDAVRGHLQGPLPINGSFSPKRRIAVIQRLGRNVTPRLLEMALKTHEIADDALQVATVFGALAALQDTRAVLPLIDTLKPPAAEWLREWSASTLGELKDPRAVEPLVTLLRDAAASDMLRASAAISLGTLQAREALPELRAIATHQGAELSLRKAAIGALAAMADASSADLLLRAMAQTHDLPFQLYALSVVGDIGAAGVLAAVRSIESGHAEEPMRKYAREARLKIEERTGTR